MEAYELKELKVLLQVMKERERHSFKNLELYNKVIEELGENKNYEHIAQVMIDKGWLRRLDKDMFLGVDSEGRRIYKVEPYYVLTNKGLKELERKKKRYNRPIINWDRVVSVVPLLKDGLTAVIRWFT